MYNLKRTSKTSKRWSHSVNMNWFDQKTRAPNILRKSLRKSSIFWKKKFVLNTSLVLTIPKRISWIFFWKFWFFSPVTERFSEYFSYHNLISVSEILRIWRTFGFDFFWPFKNNPISTPILRKFQKFLTISK